MQVRPGARLRSAAGTEVVVVRAASRDVVLSCGGGPMAPATGPAPAAGAAGGAAGSDGDAVLLGKRYAGGGVEVLCVVPGPGPLQADGVDLVVQQARALPASD